MNVSLTPKLEGFVKKKVKSGMYNSSSEVIREALRLLEENDAMREMRFRELRKEIALGIKEADNGKTTALDVAAIKAEGRKRIAKK